MTFSRGMSISTSLKKSSPISKGQKPTDGVMAIHPYHLYPLNGQRDVEAHGADSELQMDE